MPNSLKTPDLTPYTGRWVGLVGDQVAGVGHTAPEARRLAQRNRPEERITLYFVEAPGGRPLSLSPLLARIRPIVAQQEMPVYLVGGAVRDALLGRVSQDLDFVVPQQAIKLAFAVADALSVPAYVLDRERDTGRVVLSELKTTLDFACYRGPDLEADLRARDFTINAIALPAAAQTDASLIDPCNGVADLAARVIRLTHDQALMDDPVRALRALRLALALDFSLAEGTAAAVKTASPRLDIVSTERVRDEFLKLMQTDVPDQAVLQMVALNLLATVLPEIADLADVEQSAPHHEPVLPHTISVLRWLARLEAAVLEGQETGDPALQQAQAALAGYAPALQTHLSRNVDGGIDGRTLLRLGALFHDVGKKQTQTIEEKDGRRRIRFLGHDKIGAAIAARRLRRLSLSRKAVDHVKRIVAGHMRPLSLVSSQGGKPTRRAVYRFFRATKTAGLDIGLLSLADHLATYGGAGEGQQWPDLVSLVAALYHQYFHNYEESVAPAAFLDGRELIEVLDLKPGPEVGRLLQLLEEAQATGEVTTRDEALAWARRAHP